MKDVGHFPMSENPVKFREYILPVLKEIHESEAARPGKTKQGANA
jgi:hypothetical protein